MNVISAYLNQIAQWKKMIGGEDGYPPQPGPPTEIKVRWEDRRRLVRNSQGVEVVSEARVFCAEDIQPGDVLNYRGRDWPVIAVSAVPTIDGKTTFHEVAV